MLVFLFLEIKQDGNTEWLWKKFKRKPSAFRASQNTHQSRSYWRPATRQRTLPLGPPTSPVSPAQRGTLSSHLHLCGACTNCKTHRFALNFLIAVQRERAAQRFWPRQGPESPSRPKWPWLSLQPQLSCGTEVPDSSSSAARTRPSTPSHRPCSAHWPPSLTADLPGVTGSALHPALPSQLDPKSLAWPCLTSRTLHCLAVVLREALREHPTLTS